MSSATRQRKFIKKLLNEKRFDELRRCFRHTDPADIADILDELETEEIEQIFSVLDSQTASELIVEMDDDDVEEIVESLPPAKLAGIIQKMAPDDAADLLNELDINDQNRVLHLLTPEMKKNLKELAEYNEESAGGLMTPEFCAVAESATVQQAINAIVEADFSDPVTTVFAVDSQGKLTGAIQISALIAKPGKSLIKDVVIANPIYASLNDDREEVAHKVRKYDLLVIPVVDEEGKLVGRITIDDVIDAIDEEAAEDMARMAGAPDIEHNEITPMGIVRLRLPWLLITMLTGTVVSFVIQKIMGLDNAERLAAFVPVILGMGGNTGMQATAVTVRSIALGEIELSRLAGIFTREIMVGATMGTVCSVLIAIVVWTNLAVFTEVTHSESLPKMIVVVSSSMFTAMTFAAFTGTVLPIILHRFRIDPAVASGPFVTTGNDLSASLIYLAMCSILL